MDGFVGLLQGPILTDVGDLSVTFLVLVLILEKI